ncbi:MAG: recombinase family protein, partial [Actinomycetes bacterium]
LARLRAERDCLAAGEPAGPAAVLNAATVGAQWDAAEPAERRGLLVAALGSLHLVLDPAPKGGRRVFDPARVRLADPTTTLAAPAG